MKRTASILGLFVTLLASGCAYDAQEGLDSAFNQADEVIITTNYNGKEVPSVKFSYPAAEMGSLKSGLLAHKNEGFNCEEIEGQIVFFKADKKILKLNFLTTDHCNSAWIKKGPSKYHFPLDTTLSNLLKSRVEFVRQLKGASEADS